MSDNRVAEAAWHVAWHTALSVPIATANPMKNLDRDEVYRLRTIFEECVAVADNEFQSRAEQP